MEVTVAKIPHVSKRGLNDRQGRRERAKCADLHLHLSSLKVIYIGK